MFVFEFAHDFPHPQLPSGFLEARGIVEDEEPGDFEALDEQLSKTGHGRIGAGVTGNESAKHDAAMKIHAS